MMMKSRFTDAWTLAVIAAMLAGGRAEAGAAPGTSSGISLKGGVLQGGDPQYTYYIDVLLVDDTIPAYVNPGPPAVSLTLDNLTGVSSVDTYQLNYQAFQPPGALWTPTLGADTAQVDYYGYSPSTAGATPVWLFELVITTPPNTPAGLAPNDTFIYTYTIGTGVGAQTGGGTVTLQAGPPLVPEPSSIVLMLVGGAALPYLGMRRHRRRPPPRTA